MEHRVVIVTFFYNTHTHTHNRPIEEGFLLFYFRDGETEEQSVYYGGRLARMDDAYYGGLPGIVYTKVFGGRRGLDFFLLL